MSVCLYVGRVNWCVRVWRVGYFSLKMLKEGGCFVRFGGCVRIVRVRVAELDWSGKESIVCSSFRVLSRGFFVVFIGFSVAGCFIGAFCRCV